MTEDFLKKILTKIGLAADDQEAVLKSFKTMVYATLVGIMKDLIPADKQAEVGKKLESSQDWVKDITEAADKFVDKKQLAEEIKKRLSETTKKFLDLLVKETPEEKRGEILAYLDSLT